MDRDDERGTHWLWRLSARAWLDAAGHELERAEEQLGSRRTAVTHARRAAGMALNGVLVAMAARGWSQERCESIWGRSYIDHLRTLASADPHVREPFDAAVSDACRDLLAIPVMPPSGLISIARSKDQAATAALELAQRLVRACAEQLGD